MKIGRTATACISSLQLLSQTKRASTRTCYMYSTAAGTVVHVTSPFSRNVPPARLDDPSHRWHKNIEPIWLPQTALYLAKVNLLISGKKEKKKLYNICSIFPFLFHFVFSATSLTACKDHPRRPLPQEFLPIQVLLSSTQLLTKGDAVDITVKHGTTTYLPK